MMNRGYRDLRVWKEAMELAKEVYLLTAGFPKEEVYGLSQQLRRSAVSIASNIAEGSGRNNPKEFYQFLGIASGSLAELTTQLMIAESIYDKLREQIEPVLEKAGEVGKMLSGLKRGVASSGGRKPSNVFLIANNEQRTTNNE